MEFLPKEIRAAGVKNLLRYINCMHSAITTGSITLDHMGLTGNKPRPAQFYESCM